MIKLDWLKHKRTLWIAFAIVFVVLLFFSKNKSIFKNEANKTEQQAAAKAGQAGLTYNNEILGNLVNKDSDLDGVLDWEESLWGTNPNKKDTNGDGVPDNVEIENLKQPTGQNQQGLPLLKNNNENLTETDKFSREFFATVAALNQSGAMDQATIDKLSSSLAEHIQNSSPRKVFKLSDIKTIRDDSLQAVKNYDETLDSIYRKYPVEGNAINVLQKFIVDEDNVDISALAELDPIIGQTKKIIAAIIKMSVPQSLASLHLEFVNGLQSSTENLTDIKLYETDVIVALSGISKYERNIETLASANNNLANAIKQKLNN